MGVNALGQQQNDFWIRFQGESFALKGGNNISLTISLKFPACDKFEAMLLLPLEMIDGTSARFNPEEGGGELNPVFKRGEEITYNGQRYMKHIVEFTPNDVAKKGETGSFTISNFTSHSADRKCEWKSETKRIYIALLPNECGLKDTVYSHCDLTINPPVDMARTSISVRDDYNYTYNDSTVPYRVTIRTYFEKGTYEYSSISLNLIKSSDLTCIGVTKSNTYEYNNMRNVDFENVDDTIKIPNVSEGYSYYSLYFVNNSGNPVSGKDSQIFLSYEEREGCYGDWNFEKGGIYMLPSIPSTSNDTVAPRLNLNSISNSNDLVITDICNGTNGRGYFQIEIDAAFDGIEIDRNKPLYCELELLKDNLPTKDIGFYELSAPDAYYGDLGVSYYEKEEVPFTGTNTNYEDVQKIQIQLNNIPGSYFSKLFSCSWFAKNGVAAGSYICSVKLIQEEKTLNTRTINLTVNAPSGHHAAGNPNYTLHNYVYDGNFNNTKNNFAMKYHTNHTAYLQLQTAYLYDSFSYTMHNYLKFGETPIRYYYGEESNISNITEWKTLEGYYTTSNNDNNTQTYATITFTGLVEAILKDQKEDPCAQIQNKYLYILYDIQLKDNAPALTGNYANINWQFLREGSGLGLIGTYFYVPAESAINPYVSVSCDNTQFKNEVKLTAGGSYEYKYVVDNFVNQDIENGVFMVGSFPHRGDKEIIGTKSRGSNFNMPISSEYIQHIKISIISNGNEQIIYDKPFSQLPTGLPNEWSIQYSAASKPCLKDLPGLEGSLSNCSSDDWKSEIQGNMYYFMLKAPRLNKFSKLEVVMSCTLPQGVTVGQKSSVSLVAAAQYKNNVNSIIPKETEQYATVKIDTRSSCAEIECKNCETSFAPEPGKTYVLSAWVKDLNEKVAVPTSQIDLIFERGEQVFSCYPEGTLIEGWQRIQKEFTVPEDAEIMRIELVNNGLANVFFDDIRVFPFNGTMKSYVYDPITMRLTAELDDENYATFYEYDEEGALIRVKKETERGIMTIREARQAKPKNK